MNKIEELEEKFHAEINNLSEKIDKEISELKESKKQENQELELEYGDDYWFVNTDTMHIDNDIWHDTLEDDIRLKRKLIFKTSAEAEEYLEYLKAKEKAMNEFSKAEWEDTKLTKYLIYYDYKTEKFDATNNWWQRTINSILFRTRESAQEFINKYEKFMKRELGI